MAREIRFGMAGPVPGMSTADLIGEVRRFERGGFDTVWFPDHVAFMAKSLTPEVWSVITAAAQKTGTIGLGAVGDAHRMHPAVFAHRLATVDHIAGEGGRGRIFVCVGYGEKMNLDPYGIAWDRPLKRVEESVRIMRALWEGGSVNFKGDIFHLKDAELRITPVSKKGIPIYVAATGPRALRIAGQWGDGWVTNAMPVGVYKKKLLTVREGQKKRSRKLGRLEKAIYIFLSIGRDEDEAYGALEPLKHALIWPELLEEGGYDVKIAKRYKGLKYTKIMPNDSAMLEKFKEMGQKYYSRDVLLDFVIAGSKKQVIKRIEQYIRAGVDHFILRDFSPDKKRSYRLLTREIIPYFRGAG